MSQLRAQPGSGKRTPCTGRPSPAARHTGHTDTSLKCHSGHPGAKGGEGRQHPGMGGLSAFCEDSVILKRWHAGAAGVGEILFLMVCNTSTIADILQ